MESDTSGKVYLVGAGPGAVDLITMRGAEILGRAQVVIYDSLVNPGLLRLAPPSAELIHAGKESYFIVSQFNLFEYEQEAPLFARLSDGFERCILGLTLVREELGPHKPRLN